VPTDADEFLTVAEIAATLNSTSRRFATTSTLTGSRTTDSGKAADACKCDVVTSMRSWRASSLSARVEPAPSIWDGEIPMPVTWPGG
jgi:hypothetical protein